MPEHSGERKALLDHQARVDSMEHERQVIDRHDHWTIGAETIAGLSGGSSPSARGDDLLAVHAPIRENVLVSKAESEGLWALAEGANSAMGQAREYRSDVRLHGKHLSCCVTFVKALTLQ